MFGGKEASGDDSKAFDEYAQRMREIAGRYEPWVDYGRYSIGRANQQYDRLLANPNSVQDEIAAGYYESPYQRMLQDRTMSRMNMNAANTGMLGSGAANRALQDELTSMTGMFQNDYINRGMGTYNTGLQGMFNTGALGLDALGSRSALEREAAAGEFQADRSSSGAKSSMFGTIGSIAGTVIGGIYGGPAGAMAGGAIGGAAGGALDGNGGGGGGQSGGGQSGGGGMGGMGNLGSMFGNGGKSGSGDQSSKSGSMGGGMGGGGGGGFDIGKLLSMFGSMYGNGGTGATAGGGSTFGVGG